MFRNVARVQALRLWAATTRPGRWSNGFPALYTSLSLEVSLAERVKRTTIDIVELTVGEAAVELGMVGDLTTRQSRPPLRTTLRDITGRDFTVSQQIAARAYSGGLAGLLVPAAISLVAKEYPTIIMQRSNVRVRLRTPNNGINLVVFPERMRRDDSIREILHYDCVVRGVR